MRRHLATGMSALALTLAPLLCAAAPQASWRGCYTAPSNLIALETAAEAWPLGEVVVVEGFIGSVAGSGEQPVLSVMVRAGYNNTIVFASPLVLTRPHYSQCVIIVII